MYSILYCFIRFNQGDITNIGNYLTPYTLSATSVKGSNAVFAGEVGEGTKDFYAIYPYSVASSAAGGLINITVPVDQTPKAGSFGEGMNTHTRYCITFDNV